MQICGAALGVMLAFIFMIFSKYEMFSEMNLLYYNLIWAALTLGVQLIGELLEKLLDKRRSSEDE